MSGTAIVSHLLRNNAALVAAVSVNRIFSGVVPRGVAPAISVAAISSTTRNHVHMIGSKLVTERVQVTALAADYNTKKQLLGLVRNALPDTRGTINGFLCDSILPDAEGPDIDDPDAKLYMQSQDFIVKFVR